MAESESYCEKWLSTTIWWWSCLDRWKIWNIELKSYKGVYFVPWGDPSFYPLYVSNLCSFSAVRLLLVMHICPVASLRSSNVTCQLWCWPWWIESVMFGGELWWVCSFPIQMDMNTVCYWKSWNELRHEASDITPSYPKPRLVFEILWQSLQCVWFWRTRFAARQFALGYHGSVLFQHLPSRWHFLRGRIVG